MMGSIALRYEIVQRVAIKNIALLPRTHIFSDLAPQGSAIMIRVFSVGLLCVLNVALYAQTHYFITTDGDDMHNGLSENEAWGSLSYALSLYSPVKAGDTIFVKAGHYLRQHIVVEKSGSPNRPIVVQGYVDTPDVVPSFDFDYGIELDPSALPLFDGLDRTTGTAIDIDGSKNLVFKYLQITQYEYGIVDHSYSDDLNVELHHIIVTDMGDTAASYSGKAIELFASHNVISHCTVVNASAQGIYVEGDFNIIEDCRVYCDDSTSAEAATDYYIVVYDGSHNVVRRCHVERVGDLPHYGHGIGMKGHCQYNQIIACTAKNFRGEAFYVRHRGASHNVFMNCEAIGTIEETAGIEVRDGASDNRFVNCVVKGCTRAISFVDSDEDGGAQYCGRRNRFDNCIVIHAERAIDFNDYEVESPVDSNTFYNCVFYRGGTLINVERSNFDNAMVNCIVFGYRKWKSEWNDHQLDFDLRFCNFYANEFSAPAGVSIRAEDPMFVDTTSFDFHLQRESPCIDAGTTAGAPEFDFDGNARPQGRGVDIGAFEYPTPAAADFTGKDDQGGVIIYPNHVIDRLVIRRGRGYSCIKLFDAGGRPVPFRLLSDGVVELRPLAPGLYFVQLWGPRRSITVRFIKL